MDTSVCVRILLIFISSVSMVLQVIGLVGHSWFGFSLTVDNNGQKMTQTMHGGLLYFSPLKVCLDDGNGSRCRTPEQMTIQERRSFEATNQILSRSVIIQRCLVITGLASSCCGLIFLFIYLFIFKKLFKHRCSGITSAVFWIFAALPEYIAIGVQIFANFNMKSSINVMALSEDTLGMHVQAQFITPWAVILL
ncbi:uncharacterized protein LOC132722599, partial [Ruditapes philippinarum]|uniref:uncharacterized protein LOC132722599 n=1 Tax=Ruditapes philippinarum TaxID=129788 RepID=UPI00295B4867